VFSRRAVKFNNGEISVFDRLVLVVLRTSASAVERVVTHGSHVTFHCSATLLLLVLHWLNEIVFQISWLY